MDIITTIPAEEGKRVFEEINFNSIKFRAVSKKRQYTFIQSLTDTFQLESDGLRIIHFLQHLCCMEETLQKRLLAKCNDFSSEESRAFTTMINSMAGEEITDTTIEIIKRVNFYARYNEIIQTKLLEKKMFDKYIYAKSFSENKFYFDEALLPEFESTYKQLFHNSGLANLHSLMFKHKEFMEYALKEKLYLCNDKHVLLAFAKYEQTKELIDHVFEQETDLIIDYLNEIVTLRSKTMETYLFNKIIENEQLLISREILDRLKSLSCDKNLLDKYKRLRRNCKSRNKRKAERG